MLSLILLVIFRISHGFVACDTVHFGMKSIVFLNDRSLFIFALYLKGYLNPAKYGRKIGQQMWSDNAIASHMISSKKGSGPHCRQSFGDTRKDI